MSVNKVILLGNVGQDPRVKYFDAGSAVATFSLATTDRGYTLQNGTQIPDRTEWHNIVASNRWAEVVDKYVHKGDKLYVEGKIRTRSYTDQSGATRYVTEIYIDYMEMLTPKGTNPGTGAAAQQPGGGQPQQMQQQAQQSQYQQPQVQTQPQQTQQYQQTPQYQQPQYQQQSQQTQQSQAQPVQNNLADDLPF